MESTIHPVYQKDLGQRFGLRPSTITEMLNALEQKALISRVSDEWDGRYKKLFYRESTGGKDRIRAEVEETEGCLLRGISLEEQKEFMRIAGKMLQNLERDSRADKKGISDYEYKDHELMARMKISKAVAAMAIQSVISRPGYSCFIIWQILFSWARQEIHFRWRQSALTNPIFILFLWLLRICLVWGGSAVASIALGGQDQADETGVGVYYLCFSGGRCFVRGCIACFMQPILTLFGVNEGDLCVCKGICVLYFVWSAIYHLVGSSKLCGPCGRCQQGSYDRKLMIGTVANIVLDPVLISGFHLGAAGAAVATTLGNILASIYYLWYFIKKSSNFSISLKYFTCRDGIFSGICSCGLPTAIFLH